MTRSDIPDEISTRAFDKGEYVTAETKEETDDWHDQMQGLQDISDVPLFLRDRDQLEELPASAAGRAMMAEDEFFNKKPSLWQKVKRWVTGSI
jgi:hypothetical protein